MLKLQTKTIIIFILFIFLGLFGWVKNSWAACAGSSPKWTAASVNESDVSACVEAAATGDTINIPAGTASWAYQLLVAKEIKLIGAGTSSTKITNGYFTPYGALVQFTTAGGDPLTDSSAGIRVSGIKFIGNTSNSNNVHIQIRGDQNYQIDHNEFSGGGNCDEGGGPYMRSAIWISDSKGVIDSNTFNQSAREPVYVMGYMGQANMDNSWLADKALGDSNATFVEGNTFTGVSPAGCQVNDFFMGVNVVFRYNTIDQTYGSIDVHGYYTGGTDNSRGSRTFEIYNNLQTASASGGSYQAMFIRGGTGVIYNNRLRWISGDNFYRQIGLTDYQLNYNSNSQCCLTGCSYPAKDQIGRGKNQILDPLYIWNNTYMDHSSSPIAASVEVYDPGSSCGYHAVDFIKINRDYYETAKPGYAPYACPNPLTGLTGTCNSAIAGAAGYNMGSADTTPPAPPRNVKVN
jgi:hypothetical protein